MFKRPFTVTINTPTTLQLLWAFLTVVAMGSLVFGGFAGNESADYLAKGFSVSTSDMFQMLKGVSIGSFFMLLLFALGSNQVSVPVAMVENHRPTAMVLGIIGVLIGTVLNWNAVLSAVLVLFDKFDLLWFIVFCASAAIIVAVIKWWPKKQN